MSFACTFHTHDCDVAIIVGVVCLFVFLPFLLAGQGLVPGGYVVAQGPGGAPMAFPVQQTGGSVTVPYELMPPESDTQVTDQPPPYDQMSTTGGPSSTAAGDPPPPYCKDEQVSGKCCVCSCLIQKGNLLIDEEGSAGTNNVKRTTNNNFFIKISQTTALQVHHTSGYVISLSSLHDTNVKLGFKRTMFLGKSFPQNCTDLNLGEDLCMFAPCHILDS